MRASAQRRAQSTEDTEAVAEVMPDKSAAEVMKVRAFKDDELAAIDSWDVAVSMAQEEFGTVATAADELGTGFRIASEDDKERLCDVPLLFLEWTFNPGDYGDDYVSCVVLQRLDDGGVTKWIVNDGGQGIREQLRDYQQKTGRTGGLGAAKGLRVSKFYIDAETKQPLTKAEVREAIISGRKTQPAHTFYINTSA